MRGFGLKRVATYPLRKGFILQPEVEDVSYVLMEAEFETEEVGGDVAWLRACLAVAIVKP